MRPLLGVPRSDCLKSATVALRRMPLLVPFETMPEQLDATRHKDASEHRYVSDFILRAMQGLCDGSITFKKKPRLLTLRVISHLMQTFKGALRPGVGPFDAMAALHPTPAVAGTPTDLAMGAIAQLSRSRGSGMPGPWEW